MLNRIAFALCITIVAAHTVAAQTKPTPTAAKPSTNGDTKAETPAAKPLAEPPAQPVNIKIELSITDQSGSGQAAKKVVTMIASDRQTTLVRSNASAYQNIFNPPWRTGSTWSSALPGRPTAPFLPDLTFQNPFPTSVQSGLTIVVSPLISLMADHVQQMRDEGLPAMLINSSQTRSTQLCHSRRHRLSPCSVRRRFRPWGALSKRSAPATRSPSRGRAAAKRRKSHGRQAR